MKFTPRSVSAFAKARTKAFKNYVTVEQRAIDQRKESVSVSLSLVAIPDEYVSATFDINLFSTHIDLALSYQHKDSLSWGYVPTKRINKREYYEPNTPVTETDLFAALLHDNNLPTDKVYKPEKVINLRSAYAHQQDAFQAMLTVINDLHAKFYVIRPDNIPFDGSRIEWSETPVYVVESYLGLFEYQTLASKAGCYANSPFVASNKAIEAINNGAQYLDLRVIADEGEMRVVTPVEITGYEYAKMTFCKIENKWKLTA